MRKLSIALGLVLGLAGSAFAQDFPRAEIFGGLSYLSFDSSGMKAKAESLTGLNLNGVIPDRLNLSNGWEASINLNVDRWIAAEGDFSQHYVGNCRGVTGFTCKDLSYMGGPRITYRRGKITGFAHGLFGADNGTFHLGDFSVSDAPSAWAAGGGVDYAMTDHISFRVAQVDYLVTRHGHNLGVPEQNNIRVSAGFVVTLGHVTHETEAPVTAPEPCTPISEIAALGLSGCSGAVGFQVTSVVPGSKAMHAGVQPGDVIVKIGGAPVRSASEIESGIAANTSGVLEISYLIKATWLTEQQINLR